MNLRRYVLFPDGRWSWMLLLWLALICPAHAHGPFDHSTRLVVEDTRMELAVTLGADATREFLARAQAQARLSSVTVELPVELAGKFFSVTADGQTIRAEKLVARTDGLETVFTILFSRPPAGELGLRAFFFNGIEPMKRGAFVAVDEKQKPLGAAAWLSRANNAVQVTLPPGTTRESIVAAAIEPATAPVLLSVSEPVTVSRSRVGWAVASGGLLLLAFGAFARRGRAGKSKVA